MTVRDPAFRRFVSNTRLKNGNHRGSLCFDEDLGSVFCQKGQIRQSRVVRQLQRLTFVGAKIFGHATLRELVAQALGKHQPHVVVEGDQSAVECCVVQPRQTQTVANIEPLRGMRSPRQNVRGDQQFAHGELRHAAQTTEIIEHGVAEIFLPSSKFHGCDRFGRASWRAFANTYSLAREDLEVGIFGDGKKFSQGFFALWDGLFEVVVELLPNREIQFACPGQTLDSSQSQSRIQRCKVAQLHGQTIGAAAELIRQSNDCGLPVMKLPKGELVIKIQRDEELIAIPLRAGNHGRKIRPGFNGAATKYFPSSRILSDEPANSKFAPHA